MSGFGNNKTYLRLSEKELPENLNRAEKLSLTHQAGYSFIEITIDGSEERLDSLN